MGILIFRNKFMIAPISSLAFMQVRGTYIEFHLMHGIQELNCGNVDLAKRTMKAIGRNIIEDAPAITVEKIFEHVRDGGYAENDIQPDGILGTTRAVLASDECGLVEDDGNGNASSIIAESIPGPEHACVGETGQRTEPSGDGSVADTEDGEREGTKDSSLFSGNF